MLASVSAVVYYHSSDISLVLTASVIDPDGALSDWEVPTPPVASSTGEREGIFLDDASDSNRSEQQQQW